ncbi:MAG: hypothetical protein HZB42_15605 [Sphingobacteriales bacterium]|nr:hypothetical protein [Sphingobacteriales bacterium]
MKRVFTILIFVACTNIVFAQNDTSVRLVKTIKGDIASFTVDNLDNIYILNSRNQVKKLNANGDSVAVYNDVRKFGTATLIDVSNPLKVLLYYKDFTTVVTLDRLLNVRNVIDLRKQNILQARAIGQSYDNKIWVFDELEDKLKKVDEDGSLLLETSDFRLLLGQSVMPVKIFDENKLIYLYDPLFGVYVFDYYGAIKNNIMIVGWQNLKVTGNYIFGSNGNTLYRYEINTFRYDEWKMPEQLMQSKAFNFTTTHLYALKEDGIEIYSLH